MNMVSSVFLSKEATSPSKQNFILCINMDRLRMRNIPENLKIGFWNI